MNIHLLFIMLHRIRLRRPWIRRVVVGASDPSASTHESTVDVPDLSPLFIDDRQIFPKDSRVRHQLSYTRRFNQPPHWLEAVRESAASAHLIVHCGVATLHRVTLNELELPHIAMQPHPGDDQERTRVDLGDVWSPHNSVSLELSVPGDQFETSLAWIGEVYIRIESS
ncbi:MAG: hypothetical protein AAGJ40_13815 [Planctomycetota bacterium]